METEKSLRVIVAGGREFNNYQMVKEALDELRLTCPNISIVCGEARGADTFGRKYAEENNLPIDSHPVTAADWKTYGKGAGYRRNEDMAKVADALLAFWDGESKGTKHMIDLSRKYNLLIKVKRYQK